MSSGTYWMTHRFVYLLFAIDKRKIDGCTVNTRYLICA